MRNEFLPFSPPCIGEEEVAEVVDTLRSDWITTGPKVKHFEEEFAAAVDAPAALALNSCTAALHLALVTLGIGPGDAVLTTPMTFCSGVHVIEQVGARPILIDVEPDTLNIDPVKVREAVKILNGQPDFGHCLKAILPVHLYGHPCEMDSLTEIAQEYCLAVIEDAAHALPANYKGRAIGSQIVPSSVPLLTCFSFYATKNLTTAEGGMLTGSPEAIEEARVWSLHGMDRDAWKRYGAGNSWYYEVTRPGFKYNMTDLQAAIGLHQLVKLPQFHARRAEIARRYNAAFSRFEQFQIPAKRGDVEHAWHLYVLRLNLDRLNISRSQFIEELGARKIAGSVHFIPIHLHPYYRDKYGYMARDFPISHREYQRIVSLPLHPRMSDQDVDDVIETVIDIACKHNVRAARPRVIPDMQIDAPDARFSKASSETRKDRPVLSEASPTPQSIFRRAFDVTCAATGLALLSPLFVIVATAIKWEDGGPVFFRQPRVGKNLRKFHLLKFRSMVPNSGGSPLTAPNDSRITRVGRFLRKYKLDELPQLVNVVKGEMQLVGARPELERYVMIFPDEYKMLLQDRPGITDTATLTFRHEEQMFQPGSFEKQYVAQILPRKLRLSLKYFRARTFFSDLGILIRTVLGFKSPAGQLTARKDHFRGVKKNVSMSFQTFSQRVARCGADLFSSAPLAIGEDHNADWGRLVLRHRSWFIASFQALLIFGALILAWLLRFNFFLPYRLLLFSAAPVLIAIRLSAISRFGLLHGWWQYTDIDDAVAIVKAIASGSAVFVFCVRFVLGMVAFPRTIYVLEPLLSMLSLAGVRVLSRILAESARNGAPPCREVILIGAGSAAQMTIREIGRPGSVYRAVACVDDDRSKTGIKIHGVPVIGTVDDLTEFAGRHAIHEVLIAVRSATGKQMQRFIDICREADMKFKTVPSFQDIINGRINVSQLRDVRLEDLLGRDPIEIDLECVRRQIDGQVVLVTGAAGSIGSELCRQISQYRPSKLICLDHNETGIFYLQLELLREKSESHFVFCVTDVGDRDRMRNLLSEHKPRIIFHAAAYKHVPMMETNVYEAVKNNVFALLNLLEIAEENGCASFVLISSDKAVNPTNVMGATKRLGELIISCRRTSLMRCVSVRFGNVLGSSGSVVPIFQKQIRDNQQLTITHPDITRFFMTTREAVSLVLQGFAIGSHGDTLLLDMGEPVRILDLARTLIRLSGKSEHEVGIRFTGLRDGEKLFEELFYPTEKINPTAFPKIRQIHGTPHRENDLKRQLVQLRAAMTVNRAAAIRAKMKEIVPEFCNFLDMVPENIAVLAAPDVAASPQLPSPRSTPGNSIRNSAPRF